MSTPTLKDGTPIDLEFICEQAALGQDVLMRLLSAVASAFPHLEQECRHIAAETNRVQHDIANDLRKRAAIAKETP